MNLWNKKKKKTFSTISLITILCSVVIIIFLIIAIFSGKIGEWIGSKKTSDQPEVNFDLLQERRKLKDYLVFNLCQETKGGFVWRNAFLKEMSDELIDYLEWVVAIHNQSGNETLYKRGYKFINFVGEFNIKSYPNDAINLNKWIIENPDTWIFIGKKHYAEQFQWRGDEFFLKKGEPDYHEFSSKNQAIDWLRENDSYFKS
jgi:hypothetical protein